MGCTKRSAKSISENTYEARKHFYYYRYRSEDKIFCNVVNIRKTFAYVLRKDRKE